MASGYGINGGVSRCFPFWQDLVACYVMNTTQESDAGKIKCIPAREDYYECLHHTKEKHKVQQVQQAVLQFNAGLGAVKDDGSMKHLGLVAKGGPHDN